MFILEACCFSWFIVKYRVGLRAYVCRNDVSAFNFVADKSNL